MEDPALVGEVGEATLPAPETAVQAGFVANVGDLCLDQPCPDLSTAASDLMPLAVNPAEPSAPTLAQTPPAEAAPSAESPGNLAAAAQNPIANLISVPFQNNTNFGVGPDNRTQNILNIQPVVPVPLSEDLLLVTRTILPIVLQPDAGGTGSIFGLGDLNPTFFFVPVTASNLTWGVGPTLVLPTATDRQTGSGKWSAGPAGVAVVSSGQWVYGGLASQIWSFAGDNSRPAVSQFVLQPFVNYNLPNGWYLTSSPVITANWNAASGDQWTVPIGGGVGKLFRVGSQPLNASLQLYWNAVRPTNGADFSLRAQVQLLFPR
ncbi:MAG TPA: hypothetical protein VLS96_13135 [Nodosilinea sp.]|nr:hypothetical protein [Nodosilinea sp.]